MPPRLFALLAISLLVVSLLVACAEPRAASLAATPLTKKAAAQVAPKAALRVLRAYHGRVSLPLAAPGVKAQAHEGLVLRNPAAYAAFIDRLPRKRIQMKSPAPPSDDPLLKRPVVDFSKQMVIVVLRDDMYVGPQIVAARPTATGLRVEVVLPNPAATRGAARMAGIGTYHAIIVARVDGKVGFGFRGAAPTCETSRCP